VAVDDALYGRETDSGAFEFLGAVEPLEHAEQLVGVLHVKADAVILDKVDGRTTLLGQAAYLNSSNILPACKLERIRDQVDPDLLEQRRVALAVGQVADRDFDLPPCLLVAQAIEHLADEVGGHDSMPQENPECIPNPMGQKSNRRAPVPQTSVCRFMCWLVVFHVRTSFYLSVKQKVAPSPGAASAHTRPP